MAESYSESAAEVGDGQRFFTDETFKWIGIAISGLFTIAVVAFLGVILLDKVDYSLLEQVAPQFVNPFLLVLFIFVVSAALAVIGGIFVGLGRVSRTGFTHRITTGYVEFFRGTPLLFQLIVVYFGIPGLWPGTFPISNWEVPAAVIGLTLNHAAYIGEAVRGGIDAVPPGQQEAARSLGMSYTQSMREVVLPQAWRNALAAIGNDLVILIKDTSLLTLIAVPELINQFRTVYSTNFDAWTPIVLVAVAYLVLTIPLGYLVRRLESRSDWGGEHQ